VSRRLPVARTWVDARDRGLQYGDGVFETMRVRRHTIRLLDYHMERLELGCRRLSLPLLPLRGLRRELARFAERRAEAVLKLIVTRGIGARGYRPSGRERGTRLILLHPLSRTARSDPAPAQIRVCRMRLGFNRTLAGMKTLNRLESVLARAEWSDARIWEGLLRDTEDNFVCGTMSNVFARRGSVLMTPLLDRCGVAGVMRRWVLDQASGLGLRARECRLSSRDLAQAEEVFMTNAVVGVVSVGVIRHGRLRTRFAEQETAVQLRRRLELL
jgi:4-amino-4-deoxychorismate lyase